MNMSEHRQACANWVTYELPDAEKQTLRKQYFNTGYYGGYLSIYEFIKDHRQDLYQEYLVWLTKRKLLGD